VIIIHDDASSRDFRIKSQEFNQCGEGVKRKKIGAERSPFGPSHLLFSVVPRIDLSDIRWMDDSSVHTSRNVRVYALFSADMREGRRGIDLDWGDKVTPNPDKGILLVFLSDFRQYRQ
jgi:hypothetical protein